MKPVNLYTITRVQDIDTFNEYGRHLAQLEEPLTMKEHEMQSLRSLVDALLALGAPHNTLDDFYLSFAIQQIGKEFDLLRVGADQVINIELKSEKITAKRIKEQLQRNHYYLAHLSSDLALYTFIASDGSLFTLESNNNLIEVSLDILLQKLRDQGECFRGNLNSRFQPSQFLVSPLNTPEKFLTDKYFLTKHQEEIKGRILDSLAVSPEGRFIGLTGSAGTGKTLLLYDIAKSCSLLGKCCIVHCGILCKGHGVLNEELAGVEIVAAKDITTDFDFTEYSYFFIDEAHRFYESQCEHIVKQAVSSGFSLVFSYDEQQVLSRKERSANISTFIEELPGFTKYSLTNKIRTNKEIASFIRRLLDQRSTDLQSSYPSVTVLYANNEEEANNLINYYQEVGFTFINYTGSMYSKGSLDRYFGDYNTHEVIGQEYDNVLMIMDRTFYYNSDGILRAKPHPYSNYLYRQLLFQGLTRVREQLTIMVIENKPLFETLLVLVNGN